MLWFFLFAGPMFFGYLHFNFGQQPWLLDLAGGDPVFAYLMTLAAYYVGLAPIVYSRWNQERISRKILENW